ncbi:hypothetical protein Tco_1155332 [Tanacetum coccineum]
MFTCSLECSWEWFTYVDASLNEGPRLCDRDEVELWRSLNTGVFKTERGELSKSVGVHVYSPEDLSDREKVEVWKDLIHIESVNTWICLASIVLAMRKPASNASYSDMLFEVLKSNLRAYVKSCPAELLNTNPSPKHVLLDVSSVSRI